MQHDDALARLTEQVQACRRCPTMEGRRRVFGPANGDVAARVLFLAEAPGRLGGQVTGVPLSRDQSGVRFQRLLAVAGLERQEVFISNAVLCNPLDALGRNRPPSRAELATCSLWLEATLALLTPAVVVTLGATALAALGRLSPHGLALRRDVGRPVPWLDRWLYPLYHTSPRAGISRSYAEQDEDFQRFGAWLRQQGIAEAHGFDRDPPAS